MMEVEESGDVDGNDDVEDDKGPPQPPSDSSDDSSSSDSDEAELKEEQTLQDRLKELNELLGSEPSRAYEFYLEKIAIYKKLGDLGQLRTVRETMSKLYPLGSEVWMEWLQDEVELAETKEEKEHVVQLFERAVKDYLSVDIWMAYIEFVLKNLVDEGGLEKARQVFEKALVGCALHVSKGCLIWDTYREFESGVLEMMKTKEQEDKYAIVCRRQLATPLIGLDKAYAAIKETLTLSDAVEENYKNAMEKLEAIMPFENRLAECVEYADKLEVYRRYIAEEKRQKSRPPRLICLYERAMCDCPLESWFWLEYLEYVSQELKLDQLIFCIAEKAVRNCPYFITLWIKYMQQVEKYSQDKEKMKDVFERALSCFNTCDSAGSLWLKYVEYLQRRANAYNSEEADFDLLLKTLKAAEEHLTSMVLDPNPYIAELLLFDLRARVHKYKSLEKGREVWMKLLSRGYGHEFKVWLEFYHLEIEYGDMKSTRRCLEKGMNSVEEHLDIISSLWLNFERTFGDLFAMTRCEKAISKRLERVQRRMAETAAVEAPAKKQKPRKRKKPGQEDSGKAENDEADHEEGVPEKKPKSSDTDDKSNHPSNFRDKKQFQSRPRQSRDFKQSNRPFNKPRFQPREQPEPTLVRRPPKSFIPRSIQIRREDTASSAASEDSNKTNKPMSNDDFRNLYKKKAPEETAAGTDKE